MDRYIPNAELPRLAYLKNLASHLLAASTSYNTSPGEAEEFNDAVAAYEAAVNLTLDPDTRTETTIFRKTLKGDAAVKRAREIVQRIKFDVAVMPDRKVSAGIPLPRVGPAAPLIGVPTTRPTLTILASTYGAQTISFRDADYPDRRAKPAGVKSILLLRLVSEGPAVDFSRAEVVDSYTKGPIGVAYTPADNGKTATYWACWCNPRAERGPLSLPSSLTIAA